MIDWPVDLVSDLARRKTVVFLGSGISRNSTSAAGRSPKIWAEFLAEAAQGIPANSKIKTTFNKLVKGNDYLTACEVLKLELGRPAFKQKLRDEYLTPAYLHAAIHESIFKLDSRIVATPNFDKIYETYANHAAGGSIVIKHHYDPDIADAIRGTDRLILKIHGTIDSPDRMIFTRKEYAKARVEYREFYSILEALFLTHTFLFLGCGVNDPDIRLLLEDISFRHPSAKPHFFVLPADALHESVKTVLQDSMNITFLTYKSIRSHAILKESLDQLVIKADSFREELKNTANW